MVAVKSAVAMRSLVATKSLVAVRPGARAPLHRRTATAPRASLSRWTAGAPAHALSRASPAPPAATSSGERGFGFEHGQQHGERAKHRSAQASVVSNHHAESSFTTWGVPAAEVGTTRLT